jgi:hypothetical protein
MKVLGFPMLIDGRPIAVGNGIARNGFIEDRVLTLCGVRQYGKGIWGRIWGRALGACSGGVPHARLLSSSKCGRTPTGDRGRVPLARRVELLAALHGAARAALSRRTAPRQLSLMSLTKLSPMAAASRQQG